MEFGAGVADLHMHTTASDGTCSVNERVEQASARGLDAIAITDHDTISDELSVPVEEHDGVELITGVEVRADIFDTKVEILGYYVDPTDERLQTTLSEARAFRRRRNESMVERLSDVTGLALDYESIRAAVGGELSRPHLASLLVEEGLVDTINDAFGEYLGTDGSAYIPMERHPVKRVIDAIHAAGGVASLAHPGRIRSDNVDEMASHLADIGLDGIEVWYPYGEGGPGMYADIDASAAARLATEHGLIETGGSDCHGPESGKFRIGSVRVPSETLTSLRARANSRPEQNTQL